MGAAGMMGSIGVAHTDLMPEGQVLVRGEIWNAWAKTPVSQGDRVRVKAVEGLTLFVEKAEKRG
jgi:membrane-bound serine protease (ClpP class)